MLDPAWFHDPGADVDLGDPSDVIGIWARWDSYWFLTIAEHGYRGGEEAAFFPLYPGAIAGLGFLLGTADAISNAIDADLKAPGVTDVTAGMRDVPRVVKDGRAEYLLPTVVHCESPDAAIAHKEYMFPFVTVVDCPQVSMIQKIGPTLVCSAITCDPAFRRALVDAVNIDRLNLGPVPTIQLNWLQPHEGNLIDFLFRARAFQKAEL